MDFDTIYESDVYDDVPYQAEGEHAMSEILVNHAGYEYRLACEQGKLYTATCTRTGRVKTRLNPNLWHNRHSGLVTDKAVIEALENGVKQLQRQSKGPRPPIISGSEFYSGPPVRRKGQYKTNREPKGRAE